MRVSAACQVCYVVLTSSEASELLRLTRYDKGSGILAGTVLTLTSLLYAADSATAVRDVSYTWSSPLLQKCDSRTMTVLLSQVVKLVLHEWHTQTAGWLRCSLVSFKLVPALLYV